MDKWAKDLKIGDKIIISSYSRPLQISKIKRITKTLIITEDDSRFSKKWLSTVGETFYPEKLQKWTPGIEVSIHLQENKKILIKLIYDNLKKIKFSNMEMEELEKFLEQIKILNKKGDKNGKII